MSETTTRGPEQIRRDIEHTREELGETAAALAEKTDVKARAHDKLDETKARIGHTVDRAKARVTGTADHAKVKVAGGAGTPGGAGTAKQQVAEATPASVAAKAQSSGEMVLAAARSNPMPVALAGGLITGALIGWAAGRRT
jgi:ElaB/YqjD/DUF883 family membrane-anchored ribosome-binding protein